MKTHNGNGKDINQDVLPEHISVSALKVWFSFFILGLCMIASALLIAYQGHTCLV